jgi:predicted alpha/beta-hydrolase family hydrolase
MILLAPGASGGVERVAPLLAGLAAHGLEGRAVALPRGRVERAIPVYREALDEATAGSGSPAVIGGQSFGGRVASLLAADPETAPRVAALILLSYPLHAPGKEPAWDERTAHWPQIRCPVLLLSGESDPFARLERLRASVRDRLHGNARLHTYPGLGHTLGPVGDDVVERIATFIRDDTGRGS